MQRKLIITKLYGQVITSILENDEIVEIHGSQNTDTAKEYTLGNIYVGKVKNIVPNIGAAFIEIAKGMECYYDLSRNPNPVFTHKIGKKPLCIGDELIVQIQKEAVKTKKPTVTGAINFTGKYAVLTVGDTRIGVSGKIPPDRRKEIHEYADSYKNDQYGLIVRTNAKDISQSELDQEVTSLRQEYEQLVKTAVSRVCFTCLKSAPKPYLSDLCNIYQDGLTEIIVEDDELYEEVSSYLSEHQPEDLDKLVHYQDSLLPLHKLYSVEHVTEQALKERVWMKSGAYLVIQPTEALTVIDVNTGKCVSKKNAQENYKRINLEAAKEAAKQIRLRNLSGIIVIDFINLENESDIQELLEQCRKFLARDPVQTVLIDITKLQLVEVTRKKVRRPLKECIHLL